MSLAEMQSCLARLYTEHSFRQLFFREPDLCLREYNLSQQECQAFMKLNKSQVNRFAFSLIYKSREKFEKNYPLLYKVASTQFDRYYLRFYNLYRPQTAEFLQAQLLAFGKFMEQILANDPETPVYLSEIARYEWQILAAKLKSDYTPRLSPQAGQTLTIESRPQPAPGVTIEEYQSNIINLVHLLEQDQLLSELTTEKFILLVYRPPRKRQPQVLELNPASRELLENCNGLQTILEISQKMERNLGQTDLHSRILQNIEQLVHWGVLDV